VRLTIGYLYPNVMSQYGDRGNAICLLQRCHWRGIDAKVIDLDLGALVEPEDVDLFLMGGGADVHQRLIANDLLEVKGDGIRKAIEEGAAALMICGGYQLWGHYYLTYSGESLPGLGIFDVTTIHRAAQLGARLTNVTEAASVRAVDNLVVEWGEDLLVGFENHGGRTYLKSGAQPLGRVVVGGGNNSEDGYEGCVYKNAIGTYLHGSVLPKNPRLADHLITAALSRRYGKVELEPIDDEVENRAHEAAVRRALETSSRADERSPLTRLPLAAASRIRSALKR
jgi:lipid II isoglutaminyl synthase (glutamine-hydrolysing)